MTAAKTTRFLTTEGPNGEDVRIPVAEVIGAQDGPTALIVGGTHGSEYVGIESVRRLWRDLDPADVSGRVITVPCLSLPAFYGLGIHVNPIDGRNPNRSLPGSATGEHTERMLDLLWREFSADLDLLIDVHGGDLEEELTEYTQVDLVGDPAIDEPAERIARAMGMPFFVKKPGTRRAEGDYGSFLTVGPEYGIPTILSEAGSHGDLDWDLVDLQHGALTNALRALGCLEGEPTPANPEPVLLGSFGGAFAPMTGTWYPEVYKGDIIRRGQRLGVMRDIFGEELAVIESDADAAVLGVMTIPPREQGQMLLGYGELAD